MKRIKTLIGKGLSFGDLGFTSSGAALGKSFGGKVVIHTQTPAGKGIGAFVAKISSFKNENEFLYNSGSQFQPLGVYVVGNTVHVNARYIGRDDSTNDGKHITQAPF